MATKMLSRTMATAAAGKTFTIGLLPADGIGREVIPAARLAMETVAPGRFKFVDLQAGFELFQKTGVALPEETVQALKNDCQGALFGAVRCERGVAADRVFFPLMEPQQLAIAQGRWLFLADRGSPQKDGPLRER